MFKFLTRSETVVYSRSVRDSALDAYLRGKTSVLADTNSGQGWYRRVGGTRTPATGLSPAVGQFSGAAGGLGEAVTGDYRWVNMQSTQGVSTKAVSSDDASAGNTKCVAGKWLVDAAVQLNSQLTPASCRQVSVWRMSPS